MERLFNNMTDREILVHVATKVESIEEHRIEDKKLIIKNLNAIAKINEWKAGIVGIKKYQAWLATVAVAVTGLIIIIYKSFSK